MDAGYHREKEGYETVTQCSSHIACSSTSGDNIDKQCSNKTFIVRYVTNKKTSTCTMLKTWKLEIDHVKIVHEINEKISGFLLLLISKVLGNFMVI